MKDLQEFLDELRKDRPLIGEGKYIKKDKRCDHNDWCDWKATSPFCLGCGWGMPVALLKE